MDYLRYICFICGTETYEEWEICDRFPRPLTLRLALLHYLDLTTPPSPIFLKQLASLATDAAQKETLNTLASVRMFDVLWPKCRLHPHFERGVIKYTKQLGTHFRSGNALNVQPIDKYVFMNECKFVRPRLIWQFVICFHLKMKS